MHVNRISQFISNIIPVSDKRVKKLLKQADSFIGDSKTWDDIPLEFKFAFAKIYNKSGKSFVKSVFREIAKATEIQEFLPKNIKFANLPNRAQGFHFSKLNKIYISREMVKKDSKPLQINLIVHEMTHSIQHSDII